MPVLPDSWRVNPTERGWWIPNSVSRRPCKSAKSVHPVHDRGGIYRGVGPDTVNGRGGFIAAIFLVVFGLAIGGGSVRASPLVADYPGSKALATVLAKAADAYEETSVRIPPHVARQDLLLLALNVYRSDAHPSELQSL